MAIMRSGTDMKDKVFKRRKHIDWNLVRVELGDNLVSELYFVRLSRIKKKVSANRLSYWALLTVYGKETLDGFRATGSYSVFALRNGIL